MAEKEMIAVDAIAIHREKPYGLWGQCLGCVGRDDLEHLRVVPAELLEEAKWEIEGLRKRKEHDAALPPSSRRQIAGHLKDAQDELDACYTKIAALEAERDLAAAERAGMEKAAKLVCTYCKNNDRYCGFRWCYAYEVWRALEAEEPEKKPDTWWCQVHQRGVVMTVTGVTTHQYSVPPDMTCRCPEPRREEGEGNGLSPAAQRKEE